MDDLLWNDSGSYYDDNSYEDSLYLSDDLSGCSSPPSQERHMVTRMLGVPEIVTSAPEMRAVELALDPKFLYEGEKSWPAGASSGGVLFGEVEKGKGSALNGGLWDTIENQKPKQQNPIIGRQSSSSSSSVNNSDDFQHSLTSTLSFSINDLSESDGDGEVVSRMKKSIYPTSLFTPVNLELERVKKKRRRNVKTSKVPQTVARKRKREKIKEKIRILWRMVPGRGSNMDTISVLEEIISYFKFLQAQIKASQGFRNNPTPFSPHRYFPF